MLLRYVVLSALLLFFTTMGVVAVPSLSDVGPCSGSAAHYLNGTTGHLAMSCDGWCPANYINCAPVITPFGLSYFHFCSCYNLTYTEWLVPSEYSTAMCIGYDVEDENHVYCYGFCETQYCSYECNYVPILEPGSTPEALCDCPGSDG